MEFALILSLVALFRAETQGAKTSTHLDFLNWVERHDFKSLRERLEGNDVLLTGIDQMLKDDRDIVSGRFDDVDRMLAGIASGIEELRDVSKAVHPDVQLSEQANSILRQFLDSGADLMVHNRQYGILFVGGNPSQAKFNDRWFVEDDLAVLVEVGFLRLTGRNDAGSPLYVATRPGRDYIYLIDN